MKRSRLEQNVTTPQNSLSFDVFYPHSPESVWRALTEPSALAKWLMPTDFRPRLGHRFQFRQRVARSNAASLQTETVRCEVVALDEARRLSYTWQSANDPEPSLVTWTLEPVEGGTRLHLDHTSLTGPESLVLRVQTDANWQAALTGGLPSALISSQSRPVGLVLLPNAGETVRCVGRSPLARSNGPIRLSRTLQYTNVAKQTTS